MSRKVIGIVTARMGSDRLPGKVMKELSGKSLLAHHVERLRAVSGLEGIFLATSSDPLNKRLIEEAERLGCGWYAGPEEDVVARHIKICQQEKSDGCIRVPGDSPFFDIESVAGFIAEFNHDYQDYIYVSNMTMRQGTVKELISLKALLEIHRHYQGPAVTLYIAENMNKFKTLGVRLEAGLCRPEYRLTIDDEKDLELAGKIYQALYQRRPLDLKEVYRWLDQNPEVAFINKNVKDSEINRYFESLRGI